MQKTKSVREPKICYFTLSQAPSGQCRSFRKQSAPWGRDALRTTSPNPRAMNFDSFLVSKEREQAEKHKRKERKWAAFPEGNDLHPAVETVIVTSSDYPKGSPLQSPDKGTKGGIRRRAGGRTHFTLGGRVRSKTYSKKFRWAVKPTETYPDASEG